MSLNEATLHEECTVKYNDLDTAVQHCLATNKKALASDNSEFLDQHEQKGTVFSGKTDLSSVFRLLSLLIQCICWLVMMAQDPADNKWKFFVDKCLPFGASISCAHYQRFSNALKHLIQFRIKRKINNQLSR